MSVSHLSRIVVQGLLAVLLLALPARAAGTRTICLDGEGWRIATDPADAGRKDGWMNAVPASARPTRVPWIIQDVFPGYHGLAWYWRTFTAPPNPHPNGRTLLRFWGVDYAAEVWLNGRPLGRHEGGESVFVLEASEAFRGGRENLLAVRVLNPTHQPIDGIVLNQTPHRNKALPYTSGSAWNQGGIVDSVELLLAPPVRVEDVFARADWKSGDIRVQATVVSAAEGPVRGRLEFAVAPAGAGGTIELRQVERELPAGPSVVEAVLHVPQHRLWELNDPALYRVSVRVRAGAEGPCDERSVRCGFRDFRFENGWFRLNGRRIWLRCSHTGNCCPVGLELPVDPDWLRRDLLNVKAMRFNAIRFISGLAKRYQLDLADELGLMVYEESYAAWCLADSPRMAERYDESVLGMVARDRNHPSVVIWGLLNETGDGPVLRHAAGMLPALRKLDDSRLVLLNSGRWDYGPAEQTIGGIEVWRHADRSDPCVTFNGTAQVVEGLGIRWAPRQLALHPGVNGEYGTLRWSAPAAGRAEVKALFASIAERATTDVHILHNGKAVFGAFINVQGGGPTAAHQAALDVAAGDTLDFACGYGNGNYGADTTALAATIRLGGTTYDAAADFSAKANPNGAWRYGQLAAGPAPRSETFALFPGTKAGPRPAAGTFCNPGSQQWDAGLDDLHPYQRVPHTASILRTLRTIDGRGRKPLFLSEYGVGSAVDLLRVCRLYEQIGKGGADDARFYAAQRDRFLADWKAWRLEECFDRAEDFFAQSNAKMASQRLLGINAIRANPNVVGYSLTGTVDQGMTGEGLFTTFRELKPGTVDAVFDGLAPLRFCLFAEPLHAVRGRAVRVEAVLANEDALAPGEYTVRVQVVGPGPTRVLDERVKVTIAGPAPARATQPAVEPPMVLPVLEKDVAVDGPAGTYRLLAAFESGAAAAGESVTFFVGEPAPKLPPGTEVVLWGDDPLLRTWLEEHGATVLAPGRDGPAAGEVIVAGPRPPGEPAEAFAALRRRVEQGARAIFLCPEVFRRDKEAMGYLPLSPRGGLATMASWVYLKDEWAKIHPIFEGLPAGGLMDIAFYRELIPDHVLAGQPVPAEAVAGAINASQAYSSGLLVAVHEVGRGRIVLNTLRIRENLGKHPAADRLLYNLVRAKPR